jgi:iron-sulfur cluster assembly accessory protein
MLEQIQINEQTVSLTESACQAVRNILTQRNLEGYALRVYVAGGSCCGVQYGMALDKNVQETDSAFESDGIKVIVDSNSMEYLRGASIDFVQDGDNGAGFLVHSPYNETQKEGKSCGGECSCGN